MDDRLRAKLIIASAKATRGPWRVRGPSYIDGAADHGIIADGMVLGECYGRVGYFTTFPSKENAEFIALAREGVPALLNALADAERELNRLQEIIKEAQDMLFKCEELRAIEAKEILDKWRDQNGNERTGG